MSDCEGMSGTRSQTTDGAWSADTPSTVNGEQNPTDREVDLTHGFDPVDRRGRCLQPSQTPQRWLQGVPLATVATVDHLPDWQKDAQTLMSLIGPVAAARSLAQSSAKTAIEYATSASRAKSVLLPTKMRSDYAAACEAFEFAKYYIRIVETNKPDIPNATFLTSGGSDRAADYGDRYPNELEKLQQVVENARTAVDGAKSNVSLYEQSQAELTARVLPETAE